MPHPYIHWVYDQSHKLCMSQIQGCPCPPPPPGWPPGIRHFKIFFGQILHHAGPFFGQMPPSLGIFQGSNALPPGLKWQNPDWFQEIWTRFSTLPFLLFFVYQFNVYVHHFFSVYIATTKGLGTSSVRSEHCNRLFQYKKKSKSTNQYILNFVTQECFQKVRYHQASTVGKEANPS